MTTLNLFDPFAGEPLCQETRRCHRPASVALRWSDDRIKYLCSEHWEASYGGRNIETGRVDIYFKGGAK